MRFLPGCLLASQILLLSHAPLLAQQKEPLVVQVKNSIDRGVEFLRTQQRENGGWEINHTPPVMEGGQTCLATLALLTCGVPVTDPAVKNGLKAVRQIESDRTYIRALCAIVLAEANLPEDRLLLRDHVKWLIDARVIRGGKLAGWDYSNKSGQITDASNTQYAVLGIWAAKQAGAEVKNEVFESIRQYYIDNQMDKDGGWIYAPGDLSPSNKTSITMTTAGVSGLLIAAMELNAGRETFTGPADAAKNCGVYPDSKNIERGFNWINRNFTIEIRARTFYNLYGLERTGRLSGQRFFGEYDWYREGAKHLVGSQKQNGSWFTTGAWDQWPVVSTSLSLLFLSKGRTPVLVSKLVHGTWPRVENDLDWNNDRNDLRHLVSYASKELFKKQPLAWQTIDIMKAAVPGKGGNLSDADLQNLTSDLLQSPILYITGHESPRFRFTAAEKELLKRYVDNGGFILAEACCANPAFDAGFKQLVKDLWPDHDLSPLGPEHPVWRAHATVAPGAPHQLFGLSRGCKTILIYSPQDLSCRWETGLPEDPRCIQAFRLGANIVAYATGMQPPQPRLYEQKVASNAADPPTVPRGTFKVAQVRHTGDWNPAPKAMRNLMEHVNSYAGIDVALKTETRPFHDKFLLDYKFLYMHGRSSFSATSDELDPLRFNLKNGGLLFADACCGNPEFDKAFRTFVSKLLPGMPLERVPANDVLFSKDLAGEPLNDATIKLRTDLGKPHQPSAPYLEGVKYEGRWILLYSKYDLGCALERHQSTDCLGYDNPSAQRIARAAVLYTLRP